MAELALELLEINQVLDEVFDWVQKNKLGMTKEDAKRIFHRYRTAKEKPAEPESPEPKADSPVSLAERQSKQISQILNYMEETSGRLDNIENDIGYIKERVETILKKL